MKKNLVFGFSRVLCVLLLLCSALTACSDDDDVNGKKKEDTPATVAVNYSFTLSKAYADLTDATVTYWDNKGEQMTEKLSGATWTKSFTITESQEFGYAINAVPKSNIDELLTASSYKIGYDFSNSYTDSNGSYKGDNQTISYTVRMDNVKAYLENNTEVYKYYVKWNKDTNTFITK